MDYKEKVIALFNSQELSKEQKEKLENIFPELKETEDERIRKGIIRNLQYLMNKSEGFVKDGLKERIEWLEKQGEKKPADKVEPKFKVRDWVLNNVCFPMQIASIKDGMYIFTKGDAMSVSFIDENFHLWTIQDAKDGDVLLEEETREPFIYNGNRATYFLGYFLGAHCGISNGEFNPLGNNHHWAKNSCPATKEQRDLLFTKMKEAGYEWDNEKKELKKIEPIMRGTEYKHVYALRNKDTGNYLLTYWASSQKHKALFSTRKKAEEAVKWIDDNKNIEIVEL